MLTDHPFRRVATLACLLCTVLAGCAQVVSGPDGVNAPQVTRMQQEIPPGAAPGTCWGKQIIPAIIETVTHQIMLQPAEIQSDGTITSPAVFRTETVQQIVRERKENWFETPCDEVMTPEFIASLQRALKARRLYRGSITGEMDSRTRTAVRKFQKPQGLDTDILSLDTARKMGLVEIVLE